jgi:signal transduction histidine kinase
VDAFPLPTSSGGAFPPRDGFLIKCPTHFLSILRRPHEKFLQSLLMEERPVIDPAGFSAMPFLWQDKWIVICGVRVDGYYDRKRTKAVIGSDFNPVLPLDAFMALVREHRANIAAQNPAVKVLGDIEAQEFVSVTMHEIRRLNLQIKSQSEDIIGKLGRGNAQDVAYQVQTIFGTSTLITTRLDAYDFHVNPGVFAAEPRKPVSIYAKFEKARHCLSMLAERAGVTMRVSGQTRFSLRGIPILELVPVILLENAIKYSPREQVIDMTFANTHEPDGANYLRVTVSSVGPMLLSGECEHVFENKFRGEHARRVKPGTGTGLHFAKLVCDLHDIKINAEAETSPKMVVSDVPYALFRVKLDIPVRTSGKQATDK